MRSGLCVATVAGILALSTLAGCGGGGLTASPNRKLDDVDPTNMKVALNASRRGNYEAAARAYTRIYENSGHPAAALQLARYYSAGRGVPRDPVKAAYYYEIAAGMPWSGRGDAAYSLAGLYANGEGVPKDRAKAQDLYAVALDQGVTAAGFPLGRAYEEGPPETRDLTKAAALYRIAAESGVAHGRDRGRFRCPAAAGPVTRTGRDRLAARSRQGGQ
jgi:TPR repeat protein